MQTDKTIVEYGRLKDGKKISPYVQAFIYLVVNWFFSFLPIIIIWYVVLYDTVKMPSLNSLLRNGELIIICISLLLSSIYVLIENYKKKNAVLIFTLILCGLTLIAGFIVYMTAYQSQYSLSVADLKISTTGNVEQILKDIQYRDEISKKIDEKFAIIKWVSIILCAWSCIAVYVSQYFNYKKDEPHLVESRNEELTDLMAKFKKL